MTINIILILIGMIFMYIGSTILYIDFLSRLKKQIKFDKVIALFPILRVLYLYLWVD